MVAAGSSNSCCIALSGGGRAALRALPAFDAVRGTDHVDRNAFRPGGAPDDGDRRRRRRPGRRRRRHPGSSRRPGHEPRRPRRNAGPGVAVAPPPVRGHRPGACGPRQGAARRNPAPPPRDRRAPAPRRAGGGPGRLPARRGRAGRAVPRRAAPARRHLPGARGRGLPAGAELRLRGGPGRQGPAAADELHAAAHPAAGGLGRRSGGAALCHHRPPGGPRRGHRRLQAREPGGGGAPGRLPGLFRELPPRPRARPAHRRRHRGRGGLRARGDAPPPGGAAAGGRRQLPGRLGGADARGDEPGPGRADPAQRRAGGRLGGRGRPEPHALQRRRAGRALARHAGLGPRPRGLRRRPAGGELREAEPEPELLWQVLRPLLSGRHGGPALPGVRALVGRVLPDERRRDRVDRRQHLRRQQAVAQRRPDRARPAGGPEGGARAGGWSSPAGATTSPRRSRR